MEILAEPGGECPPIVFDMGNESVPKDEYIEWEQRQVNLGIKKINDKNARLSPSSRRKAPPLLRSRSILVTLAMGPPEGMTESDLRFTSNLARQPSEQVSDMVAMLIEEGFVDQFETTPGTIEKPQPIVKYSLSETSKILAFALIPRNEKKPKLKKMERVAKAIIKLQPSTD